MAQRFRLPSGLGAKVGELEAKSLSVHAEFYRKTLDCTQPNEDEIAKVLAILEREYRAIKYVLPADFLTFDHFHRTLYNLDRSSSPGHPFCREATTIGQWLKFDGAVFDDYSVRRLWYYVQNLIMNEEEHFFSVFIKDEAHKESKLQSGRFRLILASPLHFQVLWHMIFDYQNDLEIQHSLHLPSQQGISLVEGRWKQYYRIWKDRAYDVGLDRTAWDWTVPWWKLQLDLEHRCRMVCGSGKDEWISLAKKLYWLAFGNPILLLPDGRMFRQLYPGIMKSGLVNTIATNSKMQIIDHILVCLRCKFDLFPLPVACGDDTLNCSDQVDFDAYEALGSVIKSISVGLEFVGHEFVASGPVPLYFEKHLFNSFYVGDGELLIQYLDSMLRMYAHSDKFHFWASVVDLLGLSSEVMSLEYYQCWYDYSLG